MALSATGQFNIRPAASADTNAGYFNASGSSPGTDWSLQDSPQITIDGATITATVHSTTTQLNIVGVSVAASWNRNGLRITGGTATAGLYEITAVDTGNNRLTLDRSAGTAAQTGTGVVGGAFLTWGGCAAFVSVAGQKVNVMAGTYTLTTTTPGAAGPIALTNIEQTWEGYGTNPGDMGTAPVLSAGNQTTITLFTTNATFNKPQKFTNLTFDGNSKTSVKGVLTTAAQANQASIWFYKCNFKNCTNIGIAGGGRAFCVLCYAENCSNGFKDVHCYACVNKSSTSHGFVASTSDVHYWYCGSVSSGAKGFYTAADNNLVGCWTYASTGDGFSSQFDNINYANCLAVLDGGYGFNCDNTGRPILLLGCAARNTASGVYNSSLAVPTLFPIGSFVTLTGDPYTNAAGGDFSLNNTSGAGAACRAAGIPGAYLGISTTGYQDIGVQHQVLGGGGIFRSAVID